MKKPVVAITIGDAAGIGPEVALKALLKSDIRTKSCYVLIGSLAVWQHTAKQLNFPKSLVPVDSPEAAMKLKNSIPVLESSGLKLSDFDLGMPNQATGRAAGLAIEKAVELALEWRIDAVVTAPLQKEALNRAGFHFPGHTEMLKSLTDVAEVVMLMHSAKLSTALVTTHEALTRVPALLSVDKIVRTIELTNAFFQKLGNQKPRISVAALNPHAGECGLFGNEEAEIIAPAIQKARHAGIDVSGPLPSDTIYYHAVKGSFDCVVSMYHDQGLIPFKLIAFDEGVNVTLGLPFPRTSPDHGTAADIAGKNCARAESMIQALLLAYRLCENKQNIQNLKDQK
ncbi:4-hydroxythreonine-4-phosphate dehydrogenase PdxA [candidate division KSB1 bacterium]|nr:4-hydroxythreonine-4-phosphate dehydrogenase PdxA [candidate division KSB1 bacterium]